MLSHAISHYLKKSDTKLDPPGSATVIDVLLYV